MKQSALFGWGVCLVWGLCSVSCVQKEYEAADIDLTVNVGGDSLALPLGTTDTIYARTLLDEAGDADSFLKELEDGTLAICQDGGFGMTVPEVAAGRLTLPDFTGESPCVLQFAPETETAALGAENPARMVALAAPVTDALPVKTGLDDIAPEVKRIDYVALVPEAALVFTFEVAEAAAHPELALGLDVLVELPDYVRPAESVVLEDGKFRLRAALTGGKLTQAMPLDGFDFSGFAIADGRMRIEDEMQYAGKVTLASDNAELLAGWDGKSVDLKAHYEVSHLTPARFDGLFEPDIEPIEETVTFGDLPDMLTDGNTVLDFAAPYLLLSIPTNLGMAMDNELTVTPFFDGAAQPDQAARTVLHLPARTGAVMDTTKFYLADERPATLPDGYEFAACGLRALLHRIPESLRIAVATRVDEATEMTYDFGAHYTAGVAYDFVVPMAFGEELHLSLSDTLDGLPDLVNEILSKNVLRLGGTVTNTMPVDLALDVTALDADGREVPMETGTQRIKAGTAAGEPVATPLALTLGDRTGEADTRPVKALVLRFTMLTGQGNTGVPVKATSWVRAVLKAEVPGGLTVDLKELLDDEE